MLSAATRTAYAKQLLATDGLPEAGFTITNELIPGKAKADKNPMHDGWQ